MNVNENKIENLKYVDGSKTAKFKQKYFYKF